MKDAADALNLWGEYGGLLGLVVGAIILYLFVAQLLGYKRQVKQDEDAVQDRRAMADAIMRNANAVEHMASALENMPCTRCTASMEYGYSTQSKPTKFYPKLPAE